MHYTASIILAQSGEALSSETDPLETHSFLPSSFILVVSNMSVEE